MGRSPTLGKRIGLDTALLCDKLILISRTSQVLMVKDHLLINVPAIIAWEAAHEAQDLAARFKNSFVVLLIEWLREVPKTRVAALVPPWVLNEFCFSVKHIIPSCPICWLLKNSFWSLCFSFFFFTSFLCVEAVWPLSFLLKNASNLVPNIYLFVVWPPFCLMFWLFFRRTLSSPQSSCVC